MLRERSNIGDESRKQQGERAASRVNRLRVREAQSVRTLDWHRMYDKAIRKKPNTNIFVEVVRPERIVFKHAVFPQFVATASFEDREGRTQRTYQTVFEETPIVKTYAVPGAEQTMERLRAHLASLT